MKLDIIEETADILETYSSIPISFQVRSVIEVKPLKNCQIGCEFRLKQLDDPYEKDYDDSIDDRPIHWSRKWDVSNWGFFSAFDGIKRIGGAVVTYRTAGVNMLEGRDDISALWDIRVAPDYRRSGIGSELFSAAKQFSLDRRCEFMKVETQNINVPACRFYAKKGCELGTINRYAYKEFPQEAQLIWYCFLR